VIRPLHCATIALSSMVLAILGAIVPATAQINPELPAFEPRIDPTEEGTQGTGSRGASRYPPGESCIDEGDLKLLVPSVNPLATPALPGFLAVVPSTDNADRGRFVLYGPAEVDSDSSLSFPAPSDSLHGETLYAATFPLPEESGVVRLSPPELPVLEPNITYRWSISILCNDDTNPFKTSEFRIAEPSLEVRDRLGDATCSEAPALCASDGIWYDPLVSLFEARLANPDDADLEAAWFSLLESAGLADYAGVRLVDRVELDE